MTWTFPAAFWGLTAIPLYLLVDVWRLRRAPAIEHPSLALLPAKARPVRLAHLVRWTLRSLAIGAIVLGLAGPEALRPTGPATVEGIDISLALDLSRSMRAEDFQPNRLEAAKETLRAFVRARKNDRIALVVFAGDAFLQSPLTRDHEALDALIAAADFSLAEAEGTAIGDALVKAAARLKDSDAKSRIIVLLTDGENNRGQVDPDNAIRIVAALGIRVYTIGVGGSEGAPIPIDDPVYGRTYVRNPDGSRLLTRLDESLLQKIARDTGGRYFNAADRKALEAVLREIDRLERSRVEIARPRAYRSVAHWFYLAALVALLGEAVLTRTRFRVLP